MTKHLRGEERRRFVAEVVDRYRAGESIRALAASTGFSYAGMREILVGQKVRFRPRGGAHGGAR